MVSIIIAYKHDSPERLENLKFVANRYREHQVIVVEQETDTLNHVSGFYYMRVNGPWSRPKCFNEGAKIAYHDRLVFMDCDVFFEDNITGIVNAAPCVMPRRRYLWLNETQSKQIKNGQQLSGQITYFIADLGMAVSPSHRRHIATWAAGLKSLSVGAVLVTRWGLSVHGYWIAELIIQNYIIFIIQGVRRLVPNRTDIIVEDYQN
jgi:hypothetical protein